jgi:hypothetical protein
MSERKGGQITSRKIDFRKLIAENIVLCFELLDLLFG